MEKKKGTRLGSIIIATMMLTGAFFVISSSPVSADGVPYTYSVINGEAVITAYIGTEGAVVIPSTLGGYPVTGIGASAFSNPDGFSVTSITIPNSVTSIDVYAFDGCSNIKSIIMVNGLVDIGTGAFEGCSAVVSLTVPDSVTSIDSYSFYACTALSSLTLGSGLLSIGDHAFEECYSLLSLTVPNKVTSIGVSAFSDCSSLTSATISDSVLNVGKFAFFGCNALTTVTFGRGLSNIGGGVFYGCIHLTSITFLGMVAPTIDGSSAPNNNLTLWLPENKYARVGHAYAASNFPAPGNTFYGLMMDTNVAPVAPGPPTGLSATSNDGSVTLSWTAPSWNGGSSVIDYRIYRGVTSSGETYLGNTGSGGTLSFSDVNLIDGHTYYYQVSAVTSSGEGAKCSEIAGTPTATLSVPQNLHVAAGDGQVILSWTAPASTGGSPIDYYIVYQDGIDVGHDTGTSATVTGLNDAQTYGFALAAHNSAGPGPRTAVVSAAPVQTQTIPGAPTGLTATAGDGLVVLTWTAPVNSGGTPVDYYLLLVNGTIGLNHYPTTTATLTGLANGRTYSFTVIAHNNIGTSVQSKMVTVTPFAAMTVPDPPTGLAALPGDGLVSLSWSAPGSNGGSPVDYYLVYVDGVAIPDQCGTNSTIVSNLTNGQMYSFTVAAHNAVGMGNGSSAATSTPFPTTTIPDAPGGLTVVPGDGQVILSWNAPNGDGGAAIDYYVVYQDSNDTCHANGTSSTITGLTNGQSSVFAIAAHNAMGIGARSSAVAATPSTTVTVPDVPNGITAMPGDGQVKLFWSSPGNNGGADIDYYLVYVDGVALPENFTNDSAIVSGLTNGQSYNFTVAAHNVAGLGMNSTDLTVAPSSTVTVPGAPSGLTGVAGNGLVSLSWSSPGSNGGAFIDNYLIYLDGNVITHLNATSKTITGLTNGYSYNFTVAAHNLVGVGSQSSAINVTLSSNSTVPGAPVNLTFTPGDGLIALMWTAPASNGGDIIDYYVVYQDGNDLSHVTGTSITITGLTNGNPYNFTVAAHNLVGVGEQAPWVTVSLISSSQTPGMPTNLTVIPGDGLVTASWTAPTNPGTSQIDYYIVYQNGADVGHPNGTEITITGLTNGVEYLFEVAAHNSVGIGNQSATQTGTPIGLVTNGTNTTDPMDQGHNRIDWASIVGSVGLLVAAMLDAVVVVKWVRKK